MQLKLAAIPEYLWDVSPRAKPLIKTRLGTTPRCFEQVHIDIITLLSYESNLYSLTCVNRFTCWVEAFPMAGMEEATVAHIFYAGLSRFGIPLRITTDQGRQFSFQSFKTFSMLTEANHFCLTVYHYMANRMV